MNAVHRRRARRPTPAALEFDTFSVAVGLSIIVGALALVAPYLNALTVALVALAAAVWAAGRARGGTGGLSRTLTDQAGGLLATTAGIGAFFLLPGPFATARGLVLALSVVPMWWIERRGVSGRPIREGRRE